MLTLSHVVYSRVAFLKYNTNYSNGYQTNVLPICRAIHVYGRFVYMIRELMPIHVKYNILIIKYNFRIYL